ncbi:MAG: NADH-quinone oxidoreductase subunit N [Chloroflexi bacterium]|nr:NADH-quinone oxidoreductase subunit N [Chloroflexota bacterium]
MNGIDSAMMLAILPELLLLLVAGAVLFVDLMERGKHPRLLGWITVGGLAVTFVASLLYARPPEGGALVWGGMLRHDWLAFVFQMMFIIGAAATALFAMDVENLGERGEFYILLLASTLGMSLMAAAADLIMLYLAIETTSIPMYVLAGFLHADRKSNEAGFKYLLFGAMASAIMLYGFSLLYGFTNETQLAALPTAIEQSGMGLGVLMGIVVLILAGFAFKTSVVPFHFWAPDVYQGAPTPVTGFLSTASKAAGFAVLVRVFMSAFPSSAMPYWGAMLAAISVATMVLGNTLAIAQNDIKRMLAYSSIAHAGYILIGLVTLSEFGITGVVFYLGVYLLSNLTAFAVVAMVEKADGTTALSDYAGLGKRAPWLALALMVALLSLSGTPPFGGFVGKAWLFGAAVKSDLVWLAIVGVLNSVIAMYYYIVVLKVAYFDPPKTEGKIAVSTSYTVGLVVLALAVLLVGVAFAPWYGWAQQAASVLF